MRTAGCFYCAPVTVNSLQAPAPPAVGQRALARHGVRGPGFPPWAIFVFSLRETWRLEVRGLPPFAGKNEGWVTRLLIAHGISLWVMSGPSARVRIHFDAGIAPLYSSRTLRNVSASPRSNAAFASFISLSRKARSASLAARSG